MNRTQNTFSGLTTWDMLCRLSRTPVPDGMHEAAWNPKLVYLAGHSNIPRELDAVPYHEDGGFIPDIEATVVPGQSPKGWQGYQQQGAKRFAWVSGSSGARLEAYRQTGDVWILHFIGTESTGRDKESTYLISFLDAVEGPIDIVAKPNPGLLTGLFRDRIAREPDRAERFRTMARRLHAEI